MDQETILRELNFKAVKSSGAGGQHVNKTASKVELHFDVENSEGLKPEEKERIFKKLESRITQNNELVLQSGATRSQHKNKDEVISRFLEIIKEALKKKKPRKKTKPSKAAKLKRLKRKKMHSEKKARRQDPLK
ncbi:alternative ribosome rescue aminoacyl-tRNA hydrolase ArfB [Salegentibacter chungangensis]|uniref:Alternative ribosome rescue aminoacyl-tRNA hydrolase ArfB n=1 Tax=Salegentibacter chungangensis TaxID=1335724 RepID=A0ABW3NQQ2_9FLAO